ncbi:hypothetical protein ACQHIH_21415 (plasmid) [Xanthomonas sontii]|uniref:hypothetical protein n=1 Tax=Xanthomonas sontii TaxID=2650745 RepID=UPI003F85A3A6
MSAGAVVGYWVAVALEHHRWAAEARRQLRACRRNDADRRKQLRKELQRQRTRRAAAMAQARRLQDEIARVAAQRQAELARLPASIVPGLTMGGRAVLTISEVLP